MHAEFGASVGWAHPAAGGSGAAGRMAREGAAGARKRPFRRRGRAEATTTTPTAAQTSDGGEPEPAAAIPVLEPLGQGLIRDIRNRYVPHLKSDITDGLSLKTVSAAGFLFCACLPPTTRRLAALGKTSRTRRAELHVGVPARAEEL